jgi:hypothetical protein
MWKLAGLAGRFLGLLALIFFWTNVWIGISVLVAPVGQLFVGAAFVLSIMGAVTTAGGFDRQWRRFWRRVDTRLRQAEPDRRVSHGAVLERYLFAVSYTISVGGLCGLIFTRYPNWVFWAAFFCGVVVAVFTIRWAYSLWYRWVMGVRPADELPLSERK